MSIKSDKWIKDMSINHEMIKPFSEGQVRLDDSGNNLFLMVYQVMVMMLGAQMNLKFLQIFIRQL